MSLSAQDIVALARAGYNAEQISLLNRESSTPSTEASTPSTPIIGSAQIALPMIGVDAHLPLFPAGVGYCVLMELGSIIENLRAFTPGLDTILGKHKEV